MLQMTLSTVAFNSASIDQFRESLMLSGAAANTLRAYTSDLNLFLLQSGRTTIEKDRFEMEAMYWLRMSRSGRLGKISPKTILRRLTSLRKFAKVVFGEDILLDYRAPTVAPGAPHPLPEGLDGVGRMIRVTHHKHHRALLALCGYCGLRISEALTITPSSFNLENMSLRVVGKGDKERFVPVGGLAWENLAVPVTSAYVNQGLHSPLVPMHERAARKAVTNAGERANLQRRVASHDLRATFATALWDACQDALVVQRILGHASVVTTQIYIGTEWRKLTDAVNSL